MNLLTRLLGVPMAAFGGTMVFVTLAGWVGGPDGGDAPLWLSTLMLVMFVPPLAIGTFMVLGRHGVTVDRQADRLESWIGLVFPLRRKRHVLGPSRKISLGRMAVTRGNTATNQRTGDVFGVKVSGTGGIVLDTFTRELPARRFAERAARTLHLPLENRLVRPIDVRQPEELDVRLAVRIRIEGVTTEPTLPDGTRLRVEPGGAARRVILLRPRLDLGWPQWLFLAGMIGVMVWYVGPLIADAEAPLLLRVAGVALPLALLGGLYGDHLVRTEIDVSARGGLRGRKRVGPLAVGRTVPLTAIEELYFDGEAVRVVSDDAQLTLAAGHTVTDALALEGLLRAWVADLHVATSPAGARD
jgi:hypothetical protein